MINIPGKDYERIKEAMKRPVGSVDFYYESEDLFDSTTLGGNIFEVLSGHHYFKLVRDDKLYVHFFYSSPGTGTRVATVNLRNSPIVKGAVFSFQWSPEEISLWVAPALPGAEFLKAQGEPSKIHYKVGSDGLVYCYGISTGDIFRLDLFKSGKAILMPTAIEVWRQTIDAVEVLATGESKKGFQFENIITNLTISVLVTGFEVYTKRRFVELEQEGIVPEIQKIINSFYPKKEIEAGIMLILEAEAKKNSMSILSYIIFKGVINFQNYNKCKQAFNKGYSIKFGELKLSNKTLEKIKRYIGFRHQIIHVSPSVPVLNRGKHHLEKPIFSKKEVAEDAIECFNELVKSLHEKTLSLTPEK